MATDPNVFNHSTRPPVRGLSPTGAIMAPTTKPSTKPAAPKKSAKKKPAKKAAPKKAVKK